MNITNWFSCKYHLKNNSMPKYFVMNENMIPQWKSDIDTNEYNLFGHIKIKKDFNQILMVGITKKINLQVNKDSNQKNNSKVNIPILKSNLQKCIRRSKVKKAVRTGNFLLEIDPNEILRRLAIIYIEDVIIDNYFNNIVWYMTAVSKGYILSQEDKCIILNIIKHLAKSEIKEELPRIENFDYQKYFIEMDTEIFKNNYNVLWSLILRKKYGGMKCDIRMINGALRTYSDKKVGFNNICIQDFNYNLNLKEKDILLEAIDFHCTKIIEILLKKNKLNYSDNYHIYKQCIWDYRSSITNKIIINKTDNKSLIDNLQLYELIKNDLNSISKNIIKNLVKI